MRLLIMTTASSLGCQDKGGFPAPANHLCSEDLLRGKSHGPLTATHLRLREGRCHQLVLSRVGAVPSISCDFLKQRYNVIGA